MMVVGTLRFQAPSRGRLAHEDPRPHSRTAGIPQWPCDLTAATSSTFMPRFSWNTACRTPSAFASSRLSRDA